MSSSVPEPAAGEAPRIQPFSAERMGAEVASLVGLTRQVIADWCREVQQAVAETVEGAESEAGSILTRARMEARGMIDEAIVEAESVRSKSAAESGAAVTQRLVNRYDEVAEATADLVATVRQLARIVDDHELDRVVRRTEVVEQRVEDLGRALEELRSHGSERATPPWERGY